MDNQDAQNKLAASMAWVTGYVNAIEFIEILRKADEVAKALESGSRCLKRAAELMDEAAKSVRDNGL